MSQERLEKSNQGLLTGVASGIAEYYNIDPILIRLAFLISALFFGLGLIVYIFMYIIMPDSKSHSRKFSSKDFFAFFLIIIGTLYLCRNFFGLNINRYIMPLLLIGIGLFIVDHQSKQ